LIFGFASDHPELAGRRGGTGGQANLEKKTDDRGRREKTLKKKKPPVVQRSWADRMALSSLQMTQENQVRHAVARVKRGNFAMRSVLPPGRDNLEKKALKTADPGEGDDRVNPQRDAAWELKLSKRKRGRSSGKGKKGGLKKIRRKKKKKKKSQKAQASFLETVPDGGAMLARGIEATEKKSVEVRDDRGGQGPRNTVAPPRETTSLPGVITAVKSELPEASETRHGVLDKGQGWISRWQDKSSPQRSF